MKKYLVVIFIFLIPFVGSAQFLGISFKGKKHKSYKSHGRHKTHKPHITHSKPKYLTYSGKKNGLFKVNKYTEMEAGIILGTSQSMTDIGGLQYKGRPTFQDIQWSQTKMCYGIFGRYRYSKNVAFGASIISGKIAGSDDFSPNTGRYNRHNSFTNNIIETQISAQYFLPHNRRLYTPFAYYGYTGLIFFYNNPHLVNPNPDMYDIQLLNTPHLYHKMQIGIPIGIGMNYTLPYFVRVGLDIGWRKTFTDFLDGFTRPYSKYNDDYLFATVNISYIFKASKQTQFSTHRRSKFNFRRKK